MSVGVNEANNVTPVSVEKRKLGRPSSAKKLIFLLLLLRRIFFYKKLERIQIQKTRFNGCGFNCKSAFLCKYAMELYSYTVVSPER